MYKNNSRNSSKFKGCSPLQVSYSLIRKYHAIGYYSYTNRYGLFGTLYKHRLQGYRNIVYTF